MAKRGDRHYSIPAMVITETFGKDCELAMMVLRDTIYKRRRNWDTPALLRAADRFETRAKRVKETLRRQGKADSTSTTGAEA